MTGRVVNHFESDRLSIIAAHIRANRREYATVLSVAKILLTTAAAVLGFIGFGGLVWPHSAQDFANAVQLWLDAWYNTAGLLTFHLPRKFEQPDLPWELQIARFLVPALGLWLSLKVYLRLTRQRLRFFALFRLSGHVIVIGPGTRASTIARLCRIEDPNRNLVYITDTENDSALAALSDLGAIIVHAPPLEPDTYIRVNLKRARSIVVAGDRGTDNIRACEIIRGVVLDERAEDLPALSLVVAIDSPEVAAVLDASFHEARDRRIEYRLLDPLDNIAQGLTTRLLPLLGSPNGPPTIVMIGWSGAAQAIYRGLLRNSPPGFQLVLADLNAELTRSALFASAPGLAELSGLSFITCDSDASLLATASFADALRAPRVAAVIVSAGSDDSNFRIAIQLRRFARAQHLWTPPIYVQQQSSDIALDSMRKLIAAETIDVSRIYAFGSIEEQFAPAAVLHDADETMARAVHQAYLSEIQSQSPDSKSAPSSAPWEELMETFRAASRAQAEHIDVKLANIQCCRVALAGEANFTFSDEEVEHLARLEHWRWCMSRWLDGWTYGPEKKVELLQHDQLKPYDDLSEGQKDLDRQPIRNLPGLLALAHAAIQRQQHLSVEPAYVSVDSAAEALSMKAEACKRAGTIPIIDVKLAAPADLRLARAVQQRGLAVRLLLAQTFGVLARSFPRESLVDFVDALDAATDVVPAGELHTQAGKQIVTGATEPAADIVEANAA